MIPAISTSKTVVIAFGLVKANICPINQGRSILPAPDPTRNQPVIVPVICILSPASINMVGKMEAIDAPSPMVPIHSTRLESFHTMMMIVLIAQPIRSIKRMVSERARVETQMPNNLPRVNEPQNAEVRYAAVMVVSRPRVNAYVYTQFAKPSSSPT